MNIFQYSWFRVTARAKIGTYEGALPTFYHVYHTVHPREGSWRAVRE